MYHRQRDVIEEQGRDDPDRLTLSFAVRVAQVVVDDGVHSAKGCVVPGEVSEGVTRDEVVDDI